MEQILARLTVEKAGTLPGKTRLALAKWLRDQAFQLSHYPQKLTEGRYTARYFV